jgi:hypothetical protein
MTIIQPASQAKLTWLTVLAAVLAVVFSFLGAPLLRVIHNVAGSKFYWIWGLVIATALSVIGLAPVAFLIFAIWLAVGLYGELEARGHVGFGAAAVSTMAGTLVATEGPVVLFRFLGYDLTEALRESLDNVLKQIPSTQEPSSWLAGVKIDADFLIGQLPSMMAILVLTSLAFALILDRRVAFLAGLRFERVAAHLRLLEFRMPDWMIWIAMLSFLLSFLKVGIPLVSTVALNFFNVLVAAYFFQGLAVLEAAFASFRVGMFLRMMIYVFVVGQLFFLLSLVGLIDYWVDFRRRLRGMSSPEKDRNNGEHV